MRRLIATLCILLAVALLGAPLAKAAEAEEVNLLLNSGFEESESGWPLRWTGDMWRQDVGVSYLELREDGRGGGACAMIENVASNDARFIQTVEVKPDTMYRLSGWVRAEGCDPSAAGGSLSVIGSYAIFPEVHDTAGEWVELSTLILTDTNQRSIIIGARLGDYAADNVGKAWFDDLSLVELEAYPIDAQYILLRDYTVKDDALGQGAPSEDKGSMSIAWGIALFALLLLALWLMRIYGVSSPRVALLLLMLLAALIRLYLMATQPGYPTDMNCFFSWSLRMADVGPNAFYDWKEFCDYPPGYMYPLWLTGGLLNLFQVTGLDETARVIIKLVPLAADLAAVYLIFRVAASRLGEKKALLLAALYALSPGVLIDGAVWGQVDSVLALGLVTAVMLAVDGKWVAALPIYTIAVLMKPQALIAGPIGLLALVIDLWARKDRKALLKAGLGLAISAVCAAVVLLPFVWGKENPIGWLFNLYSTTLGSYEYATLSAANFFYLIGANWTPLDERLGPFTYGTVGVVFMVVVVVGILALHARRRKAQWLPFFGAMIYIGLFLFGTKMHERYLFPALLLLMLAYILRPDRRLLYMFAGYSVTFFVNCAIVLRDEHLAVGFGFAGIVLALINIGLFGLGIWVALDPRERALPEITPEPRDPGRRLSVLEGRTAPIAPMRRPDWLAVTGLTLVYAAVAFIGLGSNAAPQTVWASTGAQEVVTVDLGSAQSFTMMYYGGVNQRDHVFTVEFSADGESWTESSFASLKRGNCFQWQYLSQAVLDQNGEPVEWREDPLQLGARYVQLVIDGPALSMMEVAFLDSATGEPLHVQAVTRYGAREESAQDPMLLFDEPETAPPHPGYYYGTYFDEIYHARTGYEHANGLLTYEWTHPPLGKIFIMLGIKIFGMTPFGWRFMGALAGVLMVPAMYMLGKLLFKRTRYAFLAAFVMAFDMMHLTQTRIATIDSYAVLFIILMYLCMFRYLQMSFFRDGYRPLIPLCLSGLFMGLGCASKWICMYAGIGLGALFAWSMLKRYLEWRDAKSSEDETVRERVAAYPKHVLVTLGACVVCFVAVPFAIYYFSYIPHLAYEGGLTWKKFWHVQESIFNYHATLQDTHLFRSPWYEWPLMLKPMYYYNGKNHVAPSNVSTIMCMGNPAVWYIGLAALFYMMYRWLKPHLLGKPQADERLTWILIAFAAQFLPWMLVPRSMFIYHYFGSLPFVMLCTVYGMERLTEWRPAAALRIQIGYMAVVLVLFAAFYPIGTGVEISRTWANVMNWLSFIRLPGGRWGWLFY